LGIEPHDSPHDASNEARQPGGDAIVVNYSALQNGSASIEIAKSATIASTNHKEASMRILTPFVLVVLLAAPSVQAKKAFQNSSAKPQTPAPQSTATSGSNSASTDQAKIDPAKEADIHRLLDLAGTKTAIRQTMEGMEKNIKPVITNSLPPGDYRPKLVDLFFEKFQSHLKEEIQELLDSAVPLYDKYFSREDIKGLIQFYETPLGQKALSVLPNLSMEIRGEGMRLGEKLGRQSMMEVLSEHPELQKALEDAQKSAQQQ
jgi:uncharacterized protein